MTVYNGHNEATNGSCTFVFNTKYTLVKTTIRPYLEKLFGYMNHTRN
jgi:hypothetical protein